MRSRHIRSGLMPVVAVAALVLPLATHTGHDLVGRVPRAPAAVVSGSGPQSVKLKVVKGHNGATLALVRVFIHGQGPFVFVVDTGASQSLVDVSVVRQLHLEQLHHTEKIAGVSCNARAMDVKIQRWRVGSVDLPARTIISTHLPEQGSMGLRGLLGSDILSQFGAITLDYAHQELVLRAKAG